MSATPRPNPARRTPSLARGQQRVAHILDATEQLIAAHGFESLTTDHIAEAAGVPVGSIYQYFANKQEVLEAIMARHAADLRAVFAQLPGDVSMYSPALLVDAVFSRTVQLDVNRAGVLAQVFGSGTNSVMFRAAHVIRDEMLSHITQVIHARVPSMPLNDCSLHAEVCQIAASAILGVALAEIHAGQAAHARQLLVEARNMIVAYFEGAFKPYARAERNLHRPASALRAARASGPSSS